MTTLPKRAKPKTGKRSTARAKVKRGVAVQGKKNKVANEKSVIAKKARNIITGDNNLVIEYLAQGGEVRDKKTLNRQITSYLQWVEEAYRELRMSGIRRGPDPVLQVPIDEIYLPLQAVPTRDGARSGKAGDVLAEGNVGPEPKPIRLDDMFELGKRIVVIGGPGSGKSTVLMRFAWELARAHLRGKSKTPLLGLPAPLPLPIYAPLAGYNDYRRSVKKRDGHTLADLSLKTYLSQYLSGMEGNFRLPDDFFDRLMSGGRAIVLLLDGLDEVAVDGERHAVRAEIEKLIVGKADTHIVVTCRPAGYDEDSQLARDFRKVGVLPLDTLQVRKLALKYYVYVERGNAKSAQKLTEALMDGIERLETLRRERDENAPQLIDSPLMVRMILIVHVADQKMPEQRAELFKRVTESIVHSDHQQVQEVQQLLRQQISGNPLTDYEMLQFLAYHMHARGAGAGRDIGGDALLAIYAGTRYAPHAPALQIHATHRGGLLEKRGSDYRFTHLSLQEFLTARYLATVTLAEGGIEAAAGFFEPDKAAESWWREVALLIPGYFVATSNAASAVAFLRRLSGLTRSATAPRLSADARLASAELAATAALELLGTDSDLKAALADLIRRIYDDKSTMVGTRARNRVRAGVALGKLGDPRDEVMHVDAMRICVVPDGPFYMSTDDDSGSDDRERSEPLIRDIPYTYGVGEYTITNSQFQEFCDDGGYKNSRFWQMAQDQGFWRDGCVYRRGHRPIKRNGDRIDGEFEEEEGADVPFDFGVPYNLPNHPVVALTWYEAQAFSHWLTDRWQSRGWLTKTQKVRLPNEPEWEKSMRGGVTIPSVPMLSNAALLGSILAQAYTLITNPAPSRRLPQESNDLSEMYNITETGIQTSSACGVFTLGASVYGCQDILGNVWEYTRNAWEPKYDKATNFKNMRGSPDATDSESESENLARDVQRVLRGCSYNNGAKSVHCESRAWCLPDRGRVVNFGFRIVICPLREPLAAGA